MTDLYGFCDSPLWVQNLTWNTTTPNFTPCFFNTVLVWIPCGFLWLLFPLELWKITSSQSCQNSWTFYSMGKILLNIFLALLSIVDVIEITQNVNSGLPLIGAELSAPIIEFSSFCLILILTLLARRKGIGTSLLLSGFWTLEMLSVILQLYSAILQIDHSSDKIDTILITSLSGKSLLVTIQFILSLFPEKVVGDSKNICPLKNVSPFSYITFFWTKSILMKGYHNQLQINNLLPLCPDLHTELISKMFNKAFCKITWMQPKIIKVMEEPEENVRLFDDDDDTAEPLEHKVIKRSLFRALFRICIKPFFIGAILNILFVFSSFLSPYFLHLLLDFIESQDYLWHGILFAISYYLSLVISQLFELHYEYMMEVAAIQVKSALTSAIYYKVFHLSPVSRKEYPAGDIVNMMSVDVIELFEFTMYFSQLWSVPLTLTIGIYFVWQYLGIATLAGLIVIIILAPITVVLAKVCDIFQQKQMDLKDDRIRVMNEILNGMKILKLYAWELPFMKKVNDIRKREISFLRKYYYIDSTFSFLWNLAPTLISIACFGTYVLMDKNHILDTKIVFVSLNLFNILRLPMGLLPDLLSRLIKTQGLFGSHRSTREVHCKGVSWCVLEIEYGCIRTRKYDVIQFIKVFHLSPVSRKEYPAGDIVNMMSVDVIELFEFTMYFSQLWSVPLTLTIGIYFVWQYLGIATLAGLIVIIILAPITVVLAKVCDIFQGSIAYVPQKAWIQNATLRDNILFTQEWNEYDYSLVLESCALLPDLEVLPGGDLTEIGEKGINLSGGQKQRVSLARAVYQDADIYLLDDPLSAVDASVGKYLFDDVIGRNGILWNKTRVLVTHNISLLSEVDYIIVLDDGMIIEQGSYHQLLETNGKFSNLLKQESQMKQTVENQEDKLNDDVSEGKEINKIESKKNGQLIEEERMEIGRIKVSSGVWLSKWSMDKPLPNGQQDISLRNMRLTVFAMLVLGQGIFLIVTNVFMFMGTTNAAVKVHHDLLNRILKAPLSFFDITPIGRIINRFSKDIDSVDSEIPSNLYFCTDIFFFFVATVIVMEFSSKVLIVSFIPLWLQAILFLTGGFIALFTALLAVFGRDYLNPGFIGLALTYSTSISEDLGWLVRLISQLETSMVSLERISEYCKIEQEGSWQESTIPVSEDWPEEGTLSLCDFSTAYRTSLNPVLCNINLDVGNGEKIGIVGRTGAGKSSIILSIFRIIEPINGCILINNLDINHIGLQKLRSKLTVIPQDPVIFGGTLRMNLDPWDEHDDDSLWSALEHSHLKNFVSSLPHGLEYELTEGGSNISAGQRQLLCLARALLRRTRILFLDEATASVDLETDQFVHNTIREVFSHCTIITIAHRLHTVIECDRIIVLSNGCIVEDGPPQRLLRDSSSYFYSMARDAGLT
ncbi:multidrug resistance-associated protein 1-like [Centruroides sculpturatus]|uniref:multidrug resistance-associated protein 1-like n=2 Tax=Centruroides sculpturatus TaxID=218467 RepID=UPI000C6D87D9|nr:multidrug resistance-associated protein 1-like [Centruroides sculpturatus]